MRICDYDRIHLLSAMRHLQQLRVDRYEPHVYDCYTYDDYTRVWVSLLAHVITANHTTLRAITLPRGHGEATSGSLVSAYPPKFFQGVVNQCDALHLLDVDPDVISMNDVYARVIIARRSSSNTWTHVRMSFQHRRVCRDHSGGRQPCCTVMHGFGPKILACMFPLSSPRPSFLRCTSLSTSHMHIYRWFTCRTVSDLDSP